MKFLKIQPNIGLVIFFGFLIFGALVLNDFVVSHIKSTDGHLIENTIALKFEITRSHLWFEEALSDKNDEVLARMDSSLAISKNFAARLLKKSKLGAPHSKSSFLNNQRKRLSTLIVSLTKFEDLAHKIIRNKKPDLLKKSDEKFDSEYQTIINNANIILKEYKNHLNKELKFYNTAHLIILTSLLIYVLVMVVIMYIFRLKRIKYFKDITSINNSLQQEIAKRELRESVLYKMEENLKINTKNLEIAQQIANLGTYIYCTNKTNLKTGNWIITPQLKQVLGIKVLEGNIKRWAKIIHPEDREEVMDYFKSYVLEKGLPFKEYRIIRESDGKERWVHQRSKEIKKDSDGNLSESFGFIQDITERKIAEEALKESLQKFKSIVENSHAGICTVDDKFHLTYVNEQFSKIIGFSKKELLNKDFRKFLFDENANQLVTNRYAQRLNGEKIPTHYELMFRQKDSLIPIYIDLHASVLIDSFGNKQMFTQILDITERRKSEAKEKVLLNIATVAHTTKNLKELGVFIRSELGNIINTDNFFIALLDEKTQMISTPYMVDEKDDGRGFPIKKSITGYVINTKRSLLANKDKLLELSKLGKIELGAIIGPVSKVWLGTPLKIKDKVIGAIVVQSYTDENAYQKEDIDLLEFVANNISQIIERKRDDENILNLTKAVDQSPAAIFIVNKKGKIEYVNNSFETISGYKLSEVVGKDPRILNPTNITKNEYINIIDTIKHGKKWEGELHIKNKNGQEYIVNSIISPVLNRNGKLINYLATGEDITEKKKLEREFLNAFIEAQETEKYNFGEELHDGISQTLAAESMYISLLIDKKNLEEQQKTELLEKVKELNLRAITDARSIAHGLMCRQLEKYGLIGAIEDMCSEMNGTRKVKFKFNNDKVIEEEIEKSVKLNLYRIVQEVTTNIVRHSLATKATVNLSKVDGSKLVLEISDNGIGIDFEKMKQKKKGAGLKDIERRVELMNGTISLNSEKKKGTQYIIEVPIAN